MPLPESLTIQTAKTCLEGGIKSPYQANAHKLVECCDLLLDPQEAPYFPHDVGHELRPLVTQHLIWIIQQVVDVHQRLSHRLDINPS
ncbi:hypothetical protein PoB_002612600 [Plakobranchus ocellatus]|uniref:Uncharacterized protein n=1 Tax=Plakobranchus ocellatus TaxID=259542 RepID=A0AAV3ZKG3_9GAST|nr:hypothetical protein PoB_002612600 [Plakobranchus ocellatus]